jgi:hypothetical protein
VTVENLGDPEMQKNLRIRLAEFFRQYSGDWRITVLGAQQNTVWELTIEAPDGHIMRELANIVRLMQDNPHVSTGDPE